MGNIHTPTDRVYLGSSFLNAITAATNTATSVDTLGYTRALAVFDTAPTGTGTTSDCLLQDSPDNVTFTNVAGATFTEGTTALGHTIQGLNIDLTKRNRYLKLIHTGAGGSAAGQACGHILLFNGEGQPPTQAVAPVSI